LSLYDVPFLFPLVFCHVVFFSLPQFPHPPPPFFHMGHSIFPKKLFWFFLVPFQGNTLSSENIAFAPLSLFLRQCHHFSSYQLLFSEDFLERRPHPGALHKVLFPVCLLLSFRSPAVRNCFSLFSPPFRSFETLVVCSTPFMSKFCLKTPPDKSMFALCVPFISPPRLHV